MEDNIILEESFDYPDGSLPSFIWSEGCEAFIKDGHLFTDADTTSFRRSTIWIGRRLSGDISIEFDVNIQSSSDTANNINCFLLYSHPGEKSLKETREEREDGDYGDYHELKGYIVTFLANGNEDEARFRFRKNPGFHLLKENFAYECKKGKTYHIRIRKKGNRIDYFVDGRKFLEIDDKENSYNEGLFGFRTWHTALWWDNLVIKQI